MKLKDIEGYIRNPHYGIDVSWDYIELHLEQFARIGLEMNPDFQRGHVWTTEQQIAFVEYKLKDGISGGDIFWNCAGHMKNFKGPYLLVDGLQRITAVREFLADRIPAFGHRLSEYEDPRYLMNVTFRFHVHDMEDRADILRWYIQLNEGGVVHSDGEIQRVRSLLREEIPSS